MEFAVDIADADAMVSKGDESMIEQIGNFTCDFVWSIVLASHHDFYSFFTNFFENFIISTCK